MKANSNSWSARAQSLLATARFSRTSETVDSLFVVDSVSGDKILTASYRHSASEIERLFAEVLCIFAANKGMLETWRLSYREAESFLRDENHLPFAPDDVAELERVYTKTKLHLMSALYKKLFSGTSLELQSALKRWEELTLVEKNKFSVALLAPFSWELILCEESVMTVTGVYEGISDSSLEILFGAILAGEGKVLPMKVVAV